MCRERLTTLLLSALFLGPVARAVAGPPDPAYCEVPDLIAIVGRSGVGGADPLGTFTVVIRDFTNTPLENQLVVLDFNNCPDIRPCVDQGDPNVVVDCATRSIRARTDVNGRVTFRVMGCAANFGASPGAVGFCLNAYWDTTFLAVVRVSAFDQYGCDGVGAGDLSAWLSDFFSGQPYARSDYNGNGSLGADDLSRWLTAYFGAGSALGCGTATCP